MLTIIPELKQSLEIISISAALHNWRDSHTHAPFTSRVEIWPTSINLWHALLHPAGQKTTEILQFWRKYEIWGSHTHLLCWWRPNLVCKIDPRVYSVICQISVWNIYDQDPISQMWINYICAKFNPPAVRWQSWTQVHNYKPPIQQYQNCFHIQMVCWCC